mgnify:CR=1 FL=1
MVNLVNDYKRTGDESILNSIVRLGLSIYDNAVRAYLTARGIRVKSPEYLAQVIREFIPGDVISGDILDLLTRCPSQPDCGVKLVDYGITELGRLVDYVHSVTTHGVPHRGL